MSSIKISHSLMLGAIVAGVLAFAGRANAAGCVNDVDCSNAACGGDVCSYATSPPSCVAAGTGSKGADGWCTTDDDCKCKSLGAKCKGVYCSFTLMKDAPAGAGGSTGTGGATATGGSTGTGGSTAAGGSTGAGGSTAAGGTTGSSSSSSGGCAVAPGSAGLAASLLGFALVLTGLVRRRRA
ncbi:MAG TPA: hypothetical protein VHJ20_20790 [Polyangia bacterium]|nr:hypothetical protein [Polyangia bacterium]